MKKTIITFVCIFALAGCGTSTNIVSQSSGEPRSIAGIVIVEGQHTVNVPVDIRHYFKAELSDEVYQEQGFQQSNDLTMTYRIVSFKEGNRFKRWLSDSTGSWGEGSLVVETQFIDSNGKVLAEMETLGRIDSGIFGGSFDSVIARVTQSLALYASTSFR